MARLDEAWADIRAYNMAVIDNAPTNPDPQVYGDPEDARAVSDADAPTIPLRAARVRADARDKVAAANNANANPDEQAPRGLGAGSRGGVVRDARKTFKLHLDRLATTAAKAPKPGGIGALLAGIAFFALAVVPVNGTDTRLQLLWSTLTGNAWLPGTSPSERFSAALYGKFGINPYANNGAANGSSAPAGSVAVPALRDAAAGLPRGVGGGPALPPRQAHRVQGAADTQAPRPLATRRGMAGQPAPFWISSQAQSRNRTV